MTQRRFVVCFDGTWNTPDKGANPTNVVKMVRAIRSRDDAGTSQIVFYDKGVGTAGGTDAILGGGLGKGLTANVMDGYRFLANNYAPGDEIYVFGFSRGAYTARSLAGLIGLTGLLAPAALGGDLVRVMAIYGDHTRNRADRLAALAALSLPGEKDVRIRCVGVWDTVGSLGIPGDLGRRFLGGQYYFHDVELTPYVDIALHAVAIDEKRAAFSPTLWVSETGKPATDGQIVEQVWFAGVHSNVGGSYPDSGLSDIAFDWMARRVAALTGLAFAPGTTGAVGPDTVAGARGVDSRTWMYTGSRGYPYQRIINRALPKGSGPLQWLRDNCEAFDRRNLPPDGLKTINEALHTSVLERWQVPGGVCHDCAAEGDCARVPYRPDTLAAAIEAGRAGSPLPVIGWDGEPLADPMAVWPEA